MARFYLYIGFLPRSWPLFFQLFAQGGGEQNEIVWIIGAGRGGQADIRVQACGKLGGSWGMLPQGNWTFY